MYFLDYHVHSDNSFHGKSTMQDICKSSLEKGIKEICFTEHFSVNPQAPTYEYLNFQKYLKAINENSNLFKNKLVIKKGIEVCEPHIYKEKLLNIIKDKDLDFKILRV